MALAIAFETLVTDFYANNVAERIARRVQLALRGVSGTTALQDAVKDIYRSRGRIVHAGYAPEELDLQIGRKAYAHAFLAVAEKLPTSTIPDTKTPIADLLGDSYRYDEAREWKKFCKTCQHSYQQKPSSAVKHAIGTDK